MEREEAKRILLTYRLGEAAPPGSDLATALALAERDPELADWLEQELRFDRMIRVRLGEWPVPPQLKSSILRGRPHVPSSRPRMRSVLLALAAAVVAWLGLMFLTSDRSPSTASLPASPGAARGEFETLRTDLTTLIAEGRYAIQMTADSLGELKRFLADRGGAATAAVPARVAALRTYGCQVLEQRGHRVTLICFTSDSLGFVHLFVVEGAALPGAPSALELASVAGWNTATWQRDGRIYLLCAQADDARLKSLAGS